MSRGSGVDPDAGTVHDDVSRLPDPRSLLLRHGLRCTYSRLQILTLLRGSGQHLTATEIHARLERTGARHHSAPVYRSLGI
ncbi:transcriptional repressor [Streptomyces pseudogriseolus]|uniref:transcriptional repressor n=1 Tax=Streptomyces pseudogriseolus TaxID=36817 RepID=UPI003488D661|nr:transcriptional repressor [Streptomyces pseudogriseolus]